MPCFADENTPANGQVSAAKAASKTPGTGKKSATTKTPASVKTGDSEYIDTSVEDRFCNGQKVASKRKRQEEEKEAHEEAMHYGHEIMSGTLAEEGQLDREMSKQNAVLLMEGQKQIFDQVLYGCFLLFVVTLLVSTADLHFAAALQHCISTAALLPHHNHAST